MSDNSCFWKVSDNEIYVYSEKKGKIKSVGEPMAQYFNNYMVSTPYARQWRVLVDSKQQKNLFKELGIDPKKDEVKPPRAKRTTKQ